MKTTPLWRALRCASLFTAACCGSSLLAANLQWQPLGDPGVGGRVTGLAVSPYNDQNVIAGGDILGLAESTNGGGTWPPCLGLQGTYECEQVTFHPTSSTTVWAATMGGPWLSTNGGATWTLMRSGFPAYVWGEYVAPVEQVIFDPANSSRLLAFTGNQRGYSGLNANTHMGEVYVSTNGGSSWSLLSTINEGANVYNAIFQTGHTGNIFVSTSAGLYESTNSGSSWTLLAGGLPSGNVGWVAVSPTNGNTLWATSNSVGVYISTNGGSTWTSSSSGLPTSGQNYRVLGVAPSNASVLYLMSKDGTRGIWRSTNGGASWTQCTIHSPSPYPIYSDFDVLAIDPANANIAFGGTNTDIWKTTNGTDWYNVTSTLQSTGNWAGNGFSGQVSIDAGMSFNAYFPNEWMMTAMDSGKWLSRDYCQTFSFAGGVRDTTGAMSDWNAAYSVAFTNTSGSSEVIYATGDSNLWRTTNGGTTSWSTLSAPTSSGSYGQVFADPNNTNRVWVVKNSALYYSTNSGSSWTPVATNASSIDVLTGTKNASTIYVGSNSGVYQSTDGINFAIVGSGGPQGVTQIRIDPVTAGQLYVVNRNYATTNTWSTGLWSYTGGTWAVMSSDGGGPIANIVDVAIDPTSNTRILAATSQNPFTCPTGESGIWMKQGSSSWVQQNNGLPMLRVDNIAFRPDNSGTVVCGTDGRGYFIANTAVISGKYEAEYLSIPNYNGPDYRIISDPGFSGSEGVILDSTAVGNYLTFDVPNVAAGSYNVQVGVKNLNTRGIWQLAVGRADNFSGTETNVGSAQDGYSSGPVFTSVNLGPWSPGTTSDKWFRFNITGKNASSSGYTFCIDSITLTPN